MVSVKWDKTGEDLGTSLLRHGCMDWQGFYTVFICTINSRIHQSETSSSMLKL